MEDIKDKKGQIAIYGAREHNLKNIDLNAVGMGDFNSMLRPSIGETIISS